MVTKMDKGELRFRSYFEKAWGTIVCSKRRIGTDGLFRLKVSLACELSAGEFAYP